jgi:hypothetical protein
MKHNEIPIRIITFLCGWVFASSAVFSVLAAENLVAGAMEKVAWAGFAFRGQAATLAAQFPVASHLEKDAQELLRERMASLKPGHFQLQRDSLQDWRKGDSISLACVLESEQAVAQRFSAGGNNEAFQCAILLTGQAMFIDYRQSKVIQSVPIGVRLLFALDHRPTAEEWRQRTSQALWGATNGIATDPTANGANFLGEFLSAVESIPLRRKAGLSLLVRPMTFCPKALQALDAQEDPAQKKWALYFAHRIASALAHMHQVSVTPCVADATTEKIRLRFADASELQLDPQRAAYQVEMSVDGIARYPDPRQSSEVRDVIIYGAKGRFSVSAVGQNSPPGIAEKWQGTYGHEFVKGKQVADAEPYFYRTIIENALIGVVEKQLADKKSGSRKEFERIQGQCRL